MKRLLIIIISLAALQCSPLKRNTSGTIEQDTVGSEQSAQQATVHAELQGSITTSETTTTEQETREQEETVHEIFDTSKPIDPTTGTPPLQERITKNARRDESARQDTQTESQSESARIVDSTATVDQSRGAETRTAVTVSHKEKKGLNWWQQTLCITGLMAALFGAFKIIKSLKKFRI